MTKADYVLAAFVGGILLVCAYAFGYGISADKAYTQACEKAGGVAKIGRGIKLCIKQGILLDV